MTNEEANAIEVLKVYRQELKDSPSNLLEKDIEAFDDAIKALEQRPIDKSAMLYEIYMEGVNMIGEYQGCWVRFKDIEKIVDKYMAESEGADETDN